MAANLSRAAAVAARQRRGAAVPEEAAQLDTLTQQPAADATFEAHFAKRAVVDAVGPTLALGYGPAVVPNEMDQQKIPGLEVL